MPNPYLHHARILIVDDTPANIDVLRQYLAREGCRLSVAISGEKALKLVKKAPPDLILLDVMMPGMSGFEVCRQLKSMPHSRDIPIIFLTALSDPKDKIEGFSLGAVDYITKPLSYEEVVARVGIHMQLRTHARTLEIRNQEHEAALHRAEAVNRAKNSFFANMSHELRTPLNAIIGYADLLQEDAVDWGINEAVSDLSSIKIAASQLLQILSDMLDIARIEADKVELNYSQVDIRHLLEEIRQIMQPLCLVNQNQISIQPLPKFEAFYSDGLKLKQILLNLLNNANKFTQQGNIHLHVEICDDEVCFHVEDTGIGISEDKVKTIFQAFSQADDSSTRRYGGTGVGLAICEHFCYAMGGGLSVESELGQGSTFTARLPMKAEKARAQVVTESSAT